MFVELKQTSRVNDAWVGNAASPIPRSPLFKKFMRGAGITALSLPLAGCGQESFLLISGITILATVVIVPVVIVAGSYFYYKRKEKKDPYGFLEREKTDDGPPLILPKDKYKTNAYFESQKTRLTVTIGGDKDERTEKQK